MLSIVAKGVGSITKAFGDRSAVMAGGFIALVRAPESAAYRFAEAVRRTVEENWRCRIEDAGRSPIVR